MNVRKFTANTSRDAWRLVREALGPDAVILSNRTINGVVEILALAGEDMSSLAEPAVDKPALSESTLAAFSSRCGSFPIRGGERGRGQERRVSRVARRQRTSLADPCGGTGRLQRVRVPPLCP